MTLAGLAKSVEHRTLTRDHMHGFESTRGQNCVCKKWPRSLTWGTELPVPLKSAKVRLSGEGDYQIVKAKFHANISLVALEGLHLS
jgi:hypothetical protein